MRRGRRHFVGLVLLAGSLVGGCSRSGEVPVVLHPTQLSAHDGKRVEVIGRYAVYDMGRFRVTTAPAEGPALTSNWVVYLEFADGESVRIGARPEDERASLEGATVVARGRFLAEPTPRREDVAQMLPSPELVEVESIEPWPISPTNPAGGAR